MPSPAPFRDALIAAAGTSPVPIARTTRIQWIRRRQFDLTHRRNRPGENTANWRRSRAASRSRRLHHRQRIRFPTAGRRGGRTGPSLATRPCASGPSTESSSTHDEANLRTHQIGPPHRRRTHRQTGSGSRCRLRHQRDRRPPRQTRQTEARCRTFNSRVRPPGPRPQRTTRAARRRRWRYRLRSHPGSASAPPRSELTTHPLRAPHRYIDGSGEARQACSNESPLRY